MTAKRACFGSWLLTQGHRQDAVGALARVAVNDEGWGHGWTVKEARDYLMYELKTRPFVLSTLTVAENEYEAISSRKRAGDARKKRRKTAKASRKRNRA